jgi:hypothetical protein
VLANGRCDVLRGQCIRSNAGLYYDTYEEFVEALYSLESNGPLNARLGRNGREFFRRHYAWPVIERKYLDMFDRLKREPRPGRTIDPLPGFFARRRRELAPALDVVAKVPRGAALPASDHASRPTDNGPRPTDHGPRATERATA